MDNPVKIIFGDGTIERLNREIPSTLKNILLVTGRHVAESGLLEQLNSILANRTVTVHCGVAAEPPLHEVENIIETGRRSGAQAVVAVGGGSVIDAAKAAAALIPVSGNLKQYFDGTLSISGKGLFMAALPTTAGTGAELTPNAVLTDPETQIKKSLRHQTMYPDLAIIDPELLAGCSYELAVNSGLDAFTQAVESYISLGANQASREHAALAAGLLYRNLPIFAADRSNAFARRAMAEGSMNGALAFAVSGLGAVHGIGHPIGSLLKIPHGRCCAILLPSVLRWNLPVSEKYYAALAEICGLPSDAEGFVDAVGKLCTALGIPGGFTSYGLAPQHFNFIVKNCRSNSMRNNPRPMSDDDVISMLEELL